MKYIKLIVCLLTLLFSTRAIAQVKLVKKNKPVSRIVITTTEETDSIAAFLLQDFINRATKAQLPVLTSQEVKKIKKRGCTYR